jgi:Ca-activated chloride channel homolog
MQMFSPISLLSVPAALVATLALLVPARAALPELESMSGSVIAVVDGKELRLPLLKADYDVEIDGDIARISLRQTFANPTASPLNATYLFPLNQKAAIHAMRMRLDGQTIVAKIQRKEEARKTFEKAKAEGKAASLLTQHRPNMFTQDIAHLMPGKQVEITIDYVQNVPKIDEAYELVVPMVVGPRYERAEDSRIASVSDPDLYGSDALSPGVSASTAGAEVVSRWHVDKLPSYPQVAGLNAPGEIDHDRVSMSLSFRSPVPISAIWSSTHAITVSEDNDRKFVRFATGRTIDNRDFVLRYDLSAQHDVRAGLSSYFDGEREGYLSLLIEPPKIAADKMIGQRELVFVLDTSGSMSGLPMQASKTFMNAAIKSLRPNDYVRILRFSNGTSAFANAPVLATEENKRAALRYVAGLSASGGTELRQAVNAAFDTRQPANTTRIVVFLTDGYIGDERKVLSTISARIGDARIYAFGVGNAVNRFLLDAMAQEGRGYAGYVPVGEDAHEVAETLAARLKTPLLTDISIDWNGLAIQDQSPAKIPDLFSGRSVRVMGRYSKGGKHTIYIKGHVNGRAATLPLEIDLTTETMGSDEATDALPIIWAREQIFDKNRAYTLGGGQNEGLKQEITQLGLTYSLQSRFTSFVAVSEETMNLDPASAGYRNIPVPQVSGVAASAYPSLNLSGSSTPEPEGILGLMVVLMALVARFRRRLRLIFSTLLANATGLIHRRQNHASKNVDLSLPRSLRKDGWWLET